MRNTCALDIPRIRATVQHLVITNLQPVCVIAPARTPSTPHDNATTGTARNTPPSAIHTGYQATPPYDPQAQASTYALKCFVPPRGPFSGGE
jgi:spore germination protein YaaH